MDPQPHPQETAKTKRSPEAEDEGLLGAKGDPAEGRRDVPEEGGSPSQADRDAEPGAH